MTQHCSKRAAGRRRCARSCLAHGDASGRRGRKLNGSRGATKRQRRAPLKRLGATALQASSSRSHRAGGRDERAGPSGGGGAAPSATESCARARLRCVTAAVPAPAMAASRRPRRETTSDSPACASVSGRNVGGAGAVLLAQDNNARWGAAELLAELIRARHRRQGGPRRPHDGARLAGKISGSLEKKASFQHRPMQTTRNNIRTSQSSVQLSNKEADGWPRPEVSGTSSSSSGGSGSCVEPSGRSGEAATVGKISRLSGRRRGVGHGGEGRLRRTTRTRIIRCPYSSLTTSGLGAAGSATPPGPGEILDAISSHRLHSPPSTSRCGPAVGSAGPSCAGPPPMPNVSSEVASSSAAVVAASRPIGSDQSEIQSIIDRLREKTERARMASSSARSNASRAELDGGPMSGPKRAEAAANEMELIKSASRAHKWHWSDVDKSHEVGIGRVSRSAFVCVPPSLTSVGRPACHCGPAAAID